ncbi:uncharacterized protein [Euwallacea fornicatus]|uniref:uncharacterized protein isoform X1 n=1 Tax=Euwallacea fornicatus TaxID=995702 RepID=UPI00339048F4
MAVNGPLVRLRRLMDVNQPTIILDDIVSRNLEPLINNTKKQIAQAKYYEKYPQNESPMTRADKGPVHQRLGLKQIRLKRMVPLGTNTSSILPKKKFFRNNGNNSFGPNQNNRTKLNRLFTVQSRFQRIRSQQLQRINGVPVKLRRLTTSPATNLTVEVRNPNYNCLEYTPVQRFKMILNPEIQSEILDIQSECQTTMGPLPPLMRVTPVTTARKITDIFACL